VNAIAAHLHRQLAKIRETVRMFHLELTAQELATLQTALNHHIGREQIRVGQLAMAHGAGAPCVEKARRQVLLADRLSDKLIAPPFKLMEAAR